MGPEEISVVQQLVDMLGAPLTIVLLFIYYTKKNGGTNGYKTGWYAHFKEHLGADWERVVKKTDEMHAWHDVEDEEGVKLWYVRKGLWKSLDKLSENIEKQSKAIDRLSDKLDNKG